MNQAGHSYSEQSLATLFAVLLQKTPPRRSTEMLEILKTAGSALTAQRLRMDVIASNLANAEATNTPEGGPYKRERIVFAPMMRDSLSKLNASSNSIATGATPGGVEVKGILEDTD